MIGAEMTTRPYQNHSQAELLHLSTTFEEQIAEYQRAKDTSDPGHQEPDARKRYRDRSDAEQPLEFQAGDRPRTRGTASRLTPARKRVWLPVSHRRGTSEHSTRHTISGRDPPSRIR